LKERKLERVRDLMCMVLYGFVGYLNLWMGEVDFAWW
jgi:hypothetical protein